MAAMNKMPAEGGRKGGGTRTIAIAAGFLLLAVIFFHPPGKAKALQQPSPAAGNSEGTLAPYKDQTQIMGTSVHVTILPSTTITGTLAEAATAAFAAIREVDQLMSLYQPKSDLVRLNATGSQSPVQVHPLTLQVLQSAQQMHKLSGGAFDVTVGPLMKLYKYDKGPPTALPSPETLRELLKRVGSEKIELHPAERTVFLKQEGMVVDLGAIAKGFAVDRAAEALLARGVQNALVEVGGEVRLIGRIPRQAPIENRRDPTATGGRRVNIKGASGSRLWRVGIMHPRQSGKLAQTLERTDCAIATSGDYMDFFTIDGKRYSHIVDPLSGYPLHRSVASVTIIHPTSCMIADALATTLSVLGPKAGRRVLEHFPGVEAIIYMLDDNDAVLEPPIRVKILAPGEKVAEALRH